MEKGTKMKTPDLFTAVNCGEILAPLKKLFYICESSYGYVIFDSLDSEMDGIFANKASWTRFANRVDKEGAAYILDWYMGKRKKYDMGDFIIKRDSPYDYECTIEFKQSVQMVVGGYRNSNGQWQDIIEEIDFLKGTLTYEWLWREGDERASCIEIYLEIQDYGKSEIKKAA